MAEVLNFLSIPGTIAVVILGIWAILQIIGEILELKGKIVPEFMKIRKFFQRKRREKRERKQQLEITTTKLEEVTKTLSEVQVLLADVSQHYNADNITMRNDWMHWVNDRAIVYDTSVEELRRLQELTLGMKASLDNNTKMTEEMFVEDYRDKIISFSHKAGNDEMILSKEEFHRIFKIYDKYEAFLQKHNMTNGEVEIAYEVIEEGFKYRTRHNCFLEDIRKKNLNN